MCLLLVLTKGEARTPDKTDGDTTLCSTAGLSAVIILPDVLASPFYLVYSAHIFDGSCHRDTSKSEFD
jgi:hypothetical protein